MEDLQNLEPWKERNWDGKEVTVSIPKPFDIHEAIKSNPSMGVHLDLDRAMEEIMRDLRDKMDAACRVAVEKGCGVKVTRHIGSGMMYIEITDKVPAGEIHHFYEYGPEGEFEPL